MNSFIGGYSMFMALLFGVPGLFGAPLWSLWVGAGFGIVGLGSMYIGRTQGSR